MRERTTNRAEATVPLPEHPGRSYTAQESERDRAMRSEAAGHASGRPRVSREPLARADRLLVTLLAGLFVLVAAMLGAGALAFSTLSGQILGLQEQVGDLRTEMHEEIGGLRAEMHQEIGDLRAEMGKLSDRMTRIETLIETHLVPRSAPPAPGS